MTATFTAQQDDRSMSAAPPLVVDLDGTLCRSDTLHEAALAFALVTPSAWHGLLSTLLASGGRAAFKSMIASQHIMDPRHLPYNTDVLEKVREARSSGRVVELVSAADQRQVDAVASHLGLFDVAIGTHPSNANGVNLRGEAKAALLVERHGEKGFDYVGDSYADLAVWSKARRAIVVAPGRALLFRMGRIGLDAEILGQRPAPASALLRGMRPHQWSKNLLVFVPPLSAHDVHAFVPALIAFFAFSLVASGVYLINDVLDLSADRIHPRKRLRPLAAGELSLFQAILAAIILFLAGIGLTVLVLPAEFTAVLLAYLVGTCAYSFWLKRKMMIDIVALSGLYTVRVWGGAVATSIALSTWLLVFSMFLFFSLSAMKRQAELESLQKAGNSTSVAGRNLDLQEIAQIGTMSIAAGQIAVLVFALFAMAPQTVAMYHSPEILLLICPILLFWTGRLQLLTRRGYMTDDPIAFAIRDRVSLACGALMVGLMLVAGTQ